MINIAADNHSVAREALIKLGINTIKFNYVDSREKLLGLRGEKLYVAYFHNVDKLNDILMEARNRDMSVEMI